MVKRLVLIINIAILLVVVTACGKNAVQISSNKTFAISGCITDINGNPIRGAKLGFSGGFGGRAKIKEDGSWSVSGLKGTVTVTPYLEGWTFSPSSITVGETTNDLDFVGNQSWYHLSIDTEGSGILVTDPSQDSYAYGTKIQLKAVPEKGWDFGQWEGSLEGSKNPVIVTMDEAKTIRGVFKQHMYSLDIKINGKGTVKRNIDQDTYTYGTNVELTAEPIEDWVFSHWEGSLTGNRNTGTLIIDSNEKVTAVFEKVIESKSGGIAITFDDRSIDEWYSLMDLFNKYNAKATFFVNHFNKLNDNQIEKLKALQNSGNEIGYHGLYHLNAVKYVTENSINEYLNVEILPGINLMKEKGFNIESFAYPGGEGNKKIDKELLKYFKRIRYTSYAYSPKRVKDLKEIYYKRGSRRVVSAVGLDDSYNNTLEEVLQGIERAYKANSVIIFYGHVPSSKPGVYNTNLVMLEEILKYAQARGMKIYTISQLGT